MNHGFTELTDFVGGVCLIWDSSKVFLVPHRFEPRHITFVMKIRMTAPNLIIGCMVHALTVCLCDVFNLIGNLCIRVCREFADHNE